MKYVLKQGLKVLLVSLFVICVYASLPFYTGTGLYLIWPKERIDRNEMYGWEDGEVISAEEVTIMDVVSGKVTLDRIPNNLKYNFSTPDGDEVNLVFQVYDIEKYIDSGADSRKVQKVWDSNFKQEVTQMIAEGMEEYQIIEQINNLVKESGMSIRDADITYSKAIPSF